MKKETIAISIASLAMLGTLGNFVFNLYLYNQSKVTSLEISLFPMIDEKGEFKSFFNEKTLETYCYCEITNNSNKDVVIADAYGSVIGALGNWPHGVWGTTGGYSLKDLQKYVYLYDQTEKSRMKKALFPLTIAKHGKMNFAVPIPLPIGNDLLGRLDAKCNQSIKSNVFPRHFLQQCLGLTVSDWDFDMAPSNMEVKYRMTQGVTVITTDKKIFSKNRYLYFGRLFPPKKG